MGHIEDIRDNTKIPTELGWKPSYTFEEIKNYRLVFKHMGWMNDIVREYVNIMNMYSQV